MNIKKKLNIIDIIIGVVVLFLIFAASYKFVYFKTSKSSVGMDTLQYQVEIVAVRESTINAYHIDDEVFDEKTGVSIGFIKNIEQKPALDYMTSSDGAMVAKEKPGRINVTLTIEVQGVESETSYLAHGNRPINVGSKQSITTRYLSQDTEIIKVQNLGQ